MRRGWICWPGNSTGPWPGGWGCPESRWKRPPRPSGALDPNPVGAWAVQGETEYLRPDAWVAEIDGTLQIFVNQWDLPQFHLSPAYLQMARRTPAARRRTTSARRFSRPGGCCSACRRQETLTRCLTALVAAQEDFFRGGPRCRGLCWGGELAETLGLHPSTVSRTLGHKALQCGQGGLSPGLVLWPGGGGGALSPRGPGPHCPAGGGGGFPMSLQRPGIDGTPPGGGHPRGPANGGQVPPGTGAAA